MRRCLRQTAWKPYERATRSETLLTAHAEYLRRRASAGDYSAQVLFQELRGRQYEGSYETVKRFVRPLREMQLQAAVTRTRFETPPGLQPRLWHRRRSAWSSLFERRPQSVLYDRLLHGLAPCDECGHFVAREFPVSTVKQELGE